MDIAKKTAQIRDDLASVVSALNAEANYNTAQIAQTALQNAANLATRCHAEAEAGKAEDEGE